jgi:hypothetical protein
MQILNYFINLQSSAGTERLNEKIDRFISKMNLFIDIDSTQY